jgi:hypothetical protein
LYELMFDSRNKLSARLTDAVDLLIDFATLGEYGLEPVGRTVEHCETRHRASSTAHRNTHFRSPGRELAR